MTTPTLFKVERDGDILIVQPLRAVSNLSEEDVHAEMDELRRQLRQPDVKHLIIDFEKTTYFGSRVIREMQILWKCVCERQGQMNLCNISAATREILQIAKVDFWPTFPTRAKAIAAIRE